ncbi:TPA: hypothetical protein M2Q89_000678 [Escherichia coli]|nr:hypothetical protein [Escherichia coli]
MKKSISAMLLCLISTGVFAQTTCVQEPGGNIQCTGFDSNGGYVQSTTTQTPGGNYETQGFNSDGSMYNETCYTTPGGAMICN